MSLHLLIIPSEEFIPIRNPIAGIFQHDQAKILQEKGNQVGVLSFRFSYSYAAIIKMMLGKKNKNTSHISFFNALSLLIQKTLFPYHSSLNFESIDQINVVRCDGFWAFTNSSKPYNKYKQWLKYGEFALKRYIQKYGKPDVIHAHNMIYAGLFATEIKKKYNIPVVITEHSSQYAMEELDLELERLLQQGFQQNEYIFAVSPKLIELLNSKFFKNGQKSNIKWLPNVIDTNIEQEPLSPYVRNDVVRFLNIGNLIPLKGQKELITAFKNAFEKIEDVELIIAGQGYLQESLQDLIHQLHLKNKVKLVGLIDRREVIRQMDEANVFVLPSHYETFGVVLIEALSRGIPVISTYCGGPECIVNESNGILVQPKNTGQLAHALKEMYNNFLQYDKKILRQSVLELYGANSFYKKIMEIYESMIFENIK